LKRNLEQLSQKEYDIIIVGAGIFGCCALWDAISRGLSAVLIDKGDFSQATSANHYKFVHGGIRYLQHADFARVRESSRERSALLRIAPHMVKPMPVVIPTYGHGVKGKEFLSAGLMVYDMVTYDRNKGIKDKDRKIPAGNYCQKRKY
jgi:glycerol-3-phosphate dehydrogenase